MDRVARLQNLNTSFSLASLAEGSEVISEADEILEVREVNNHIYLFIQALFYLNAFIILFVFSNN